MGMNLAMASIPKVIVVQKASKIYNMALLYILLKILKEYESDTLLKYYN